MDSFVAAWVEDSDVDHDHDVEQHEKISSLLSLVQEKDADIVALKNKLSSTMSMLDLVTKDELEEEPHEPIRRQKCIKTLAKFEFYKLHKNDDQVLRDVATFKKTFPHLKVTWQFRKSITDTMFVELK